MNRYTEHFIYENLFYQTFFKIDFGSIICLSRVATVHVLATGYKLRSAGTVELEGHGLWSAGTVELEDEDRRATDGSVVWELKHEEKKGIPLPGFEHGSSG
jgi:hypothetical protein